MADPSKCGGSRVETDISVKDGLRSVHRVASIHDIILQKNLNSQDFWEFWRMRRQCVPGYPFPPEREPGVRG